MMRRTRIALTVAGVFAALGVGVWWGEHSGWPMLRQPIENAATRGAGVPVQLQGRVRTHLLWNPRLEVDTLQIASDPRFGAPHLLHANHVMLAWQWGDIWRWHRGGRLHLQALHAGDLDAQLMRMADGDANWQLGAKDEAAPKDPHADPMASMPRFGSLQVGQGQVLLKDQAQDIDLDIRVKGREGDAVSSATAGYDATIDGRYRTMPMKLKVHAGSTLPLLQDPEISPDAPWVPVRVEGTVAAARLLFDGQTAALLGTPRLQGQLEFQGRSLAEVGKPLGITLPQTPPFDLRGTLAHNAGVWRLQASRASIGSSRLAGDLSFHQRSTPSRLTGELTGSKLAFADLGPAVGGKGAAAVPAPPANNGRVLPQRDFDLPSLKVMDADVQVRIDELDFGTDAMAPLRQLQTRIHLDGGVLRLDDLQANASGGHFKGMTQLDANAQPAKWLAKMDISGVDIAGWMRGLRPDSATGKAPAPTATTALKKQREQARQGGEQAVQSYLTGTLSARLDVTGAGNSTGDILASLNGPMDLRLRDGTISHLATEAMGLDVAQALGVLVRGDHPLPLRCARLDLRARNGVVEPRLAVIDNQDSTVRITGSVNLRDESLALRLVTQPKDWSLLSLRTPITLNGSLGKPAIGIEGRRLAGRVLGAVALGVAAGPAAAVIPLMEQGQKNEADPCEAQASEAAPAAGATATPKKP
ncbi:AsmA family protein [Hydrogenophaga palleronii]|uniref:AsmA family protein n=1 Tax=Hydrogenophaga palleronii TaxID=65655 RepID=UPI0008268DC2|nr:AsmA family protein [Hydrogenophaga palleronii]